MAGFSKVSVSYEGLNKAGAALSKGATDYTRIYTQLFSAAEQMGDAWKGEDNLKFVEQIKNCSDRLKAMTLKLEDGAKTLSVMVENYKTTTANNKSRIGTLKN